jgi:hypothetical protein
MYNSNYVLCEYYNSNMHYFVVIIVSSVANHSVFTTTAFTQTSNPAVFERDGNVGISFTDII